MSLSRSRTSARALLLTAILAPALVLSSLALASPAQAQRIKPTFWGMHDNDWTTAPSVPVGSANFTTAGTYWPQVETSEGVYDWTRLDQQVAAARRVHAKPMVVLGQSPQFYSAKPSASDYRTYMPSVSAWKAYVSQVAHRYGTSIDYQIWPEPNIIQNWHGSPAQMAQLTAVASNAINKYAGKRAVVVSPAVALRAPDQQAWTVKYFKQRVGGKPVSAYVDAIAIDPFPAQDGIPEDSYQLMRSIKQKLARIKVRKPFWNNEINYGVAGGHATTKTRYSRAKQQSYVIRTYALSAAAGMQRTYWLGWFSSPELAIGMTNDRGAALPAARSYAVVRSWLNGTNLRGCVTKRGLWTCTAKKGKEVRRIYWKTRGKSRVTTVPSTLRIENQNGASKRHRGAIKIRVDYRPVMVASRK